MKQTVEEAARENILFNHRTVDRTLSGKDLARFGEVNFIAGTEWQAKQSPWISVEERLPEIHQDVLVLCKCHGFVHIYTSMYFGEEDWKFGMSDICAWMSIPTFDQILEANKDVLQRLK